MFCPKCGTENPETGRFCRSCGTDLGNVSTALSGGLTRQAQPPVLLSRKGKPVSYEGAIVKLFSGIAFVAVTIALAFSQMGRGWWFWMLIPAFSALGSGIAQLVQLKKYEQQTGSFVPQNAQNVISQPTQNNALPPNQTEYVKPQGSIYDTGELIVQPSVTEGTTRHLEINKEGETMTLPKPTKN